MSFAAELKSEQNYLRQARAELARMREHTLSLQASGGDAIAEEQLGIILAARAKSLIDDPGTALFFGRLDVAAGASLDDVEPQHRWYVGRRYVSDAAGDPLVIDWRADVSTAFYRASPQAPMGVALRRRFGLEGGNITAFEDEPLADPAQAEPQQPGPLHSQILAHEIERPRSGPMRDIVATIQPEQDSIVRADASMSVCVQGAPGTGKTAVGLHRAAWLLYAFRDKLSRSGVLVVGPNDTFLAHIGAVLPSLGEASVRHTSVQGLTALAPVRSVDEPAVATLKGDARMAAVLRKALWSRLHSPQEPLVAPRGVRKWRVPTYAVAEVMDELTGRQVAYNAAREMFPQRLAHAVLRKMEQAGDSPDDRVQQAVARSKPVRDYVGQHWPTVTPAAVLHRLFADGDALAEAAGEVLTAEERMMLLWAKPAKTPGAAKWSAADTVLLDELADLIDRTPSLGHVIVDEAQDLSQMQLRAVGRRAASGSLTVLGDIAQGTTPWATSSWTQALGHLGAPQAHIEVLDRGFRVPGAVIDYAAQLLPTIAPELGSPISVRQDRGRLDVRLVSTLTDALADEVDAVLQHEGTLGVIASDQQIESLAIALGDRSFDILGREESAEPAPRLHLVPASLSKGLEFDQVIVVEPANIVSAEPDQRTGLRRLYVVLTRAVSGLSVLHTEDLPAELTP